MPDIDFLIIKKIREEEIRRGWVRIPESQRKGIPSESLVKITNYLTDKSTKRIVLGIIPDTGVNIIQMDENTREILGITDDQIDKEGQFVIRQYSPVGNIFATICYYYHHPDFPLRFSTRVALLLGSTSVILGLMSFVLTFF